MTKNFASGWQWGECGRPRQRTVHPLLPLHPPRHGRHRQGDRGLLYELGSKSTYYFTDGLRLTLHLGPSLRVMIDRASSAFGYITRLYIPLGRRAYLLIFTCFRGAQKKGRGELAPCGPCKEKKFLCMLNMCCSFFLYIFACCKT